ncbi:MAG: hypothetical protein ACM3YO_01465 [Bacteroidota bacterium]
MKRIVFLGISLFFVLLPFFFLWQGASRPTRTAYHHHGGGWFFYSYRMGRGGDDYRGNGGGFRGGGPGFRGK